MWVWLVNVNQEQNLWSFKTVPQFVGYFWSLSQYVWTVWTFLLIRLKHSSFFSFLTLRPFHSRLIIICSYCQNPMHSRFVWVNNKGRKMTLCTQWGRNRNSSHTSSRTEETDGMVSSWSAGETHREGEAGQWKGMQLKRNVPNSGPADFRVPFLLLFFLSLYPSIPSSHCHSNEWWTSFFLSFHDRRKGIKF